MTLRSLRTTRDRLAAWGFACGSVVALASCGGLTDQYTGSQHLTIQTLSPGVIWSESDTTTFSDSIPAGKKVRLVGATLTSSTGEFTWLASLSGSAPSGQELVSLGATPPATATVNLTIDYDGDLVPLMLSANSIEIDWTAQFASTLTQSYPDGVELTITYSLMTE